VGRRRVTHLARGRADRPHPSEQREAVGLEPELASDERSTHRAL
jgi:hypothetical protein